MNNLLEVINDFIPEINNKRKYWFVRTDSGHNFESFLKGKYIGIGWNDISLFDITNRSAGADQLKAKIAKSEKLDLKLSKGKGSATSIANKLIRFTDSLKKGDLIIIPSSSSSRIAFGEIKESKVYIENNPTDGCTYYKRKKVEWLDVKNLKELDPIFYQIIQSRHAISSIDKYDSYLDKNVKTFFKKGDNSHFIININTKKNIPVFTLFETWTELIRLSEEFANQENVEFDAKDIIAKINVQSPGDVELVVNSVQTIVIIALVFGTITGIDFSIDSKYIKAQFKMKGLIEKITLFLNNKAKRKTVEKLRDNLGELETESKDVIEAMKELNEK